jgi:hypothetical protein
MDNDINDTTTGVMPFAQFAIRIGVVAGAYVASVTAANWMVQRMQRKTIEMLAEDQSSTNPT